MREFSRMSRIVALFMQLWLRNPDMRFFQLVSYIQSELPDGAVNERECVFVDEMSYDKDGKVNYISHIREDPFHVEDDVLEETLYRLLSEGTPEEPS